MELTKVSKYQCFLNNIGLFVQPHCAESKHNACPHFQILENEYF